LNIKQIKSLAEILKESDLSVIEVCEGENKVRLERSVINHVAHSVTEIPKQPSIKKEKENDTAINFNNVTEIKSPMIGVFYCAPSPDSEPFVKIGSKVKKGDVLCIVEAMKLMNDITAEVDGEIVDICAEDGQVVEFGQTIFKIY